ncbi:MAG: thioredoxin [Lachnospiraceae bacterium]
MLEIKVTKQNFEKEVLNSDRPVLIDFWASWCGPCRLLGPVLSEIANEHPEIKVCKVNVDEEMELARAFNITSIPMVAAIKDGKIVETSVGFRPKEQIVEMLKEN